MDQSTRDDVALAALIVGGLAYVIGFTFPFIARALQDLKHEKDRHRMHMKERDLHYDAAKAAAARGERWPDQRVWIDLRHDVENLKNGVVK